MDFSACMAIALLLQGLVVTGSEGEGSSPTIYTFFPHNFRVNHLKIVLQLLERKSMSSVSVFKPDARKNLVKRKFRALIIFSSCTDSSCNTVENKTLLIRFRSGDRRIISK